jgi:hypothetical protein
MPGLAAMESHHNIKRVLVCPSDPDDEVSELHAVDGWSEVDAVAIGQAAKQPVTSG